MANELDKLRGLCCCVAGIKNPALRSFQVGHQVSNPFLVILPSSHCGLVATMLPGLHPSSAAEI
jgi:hypothetical protein